MAKIVLALLLLLGGCATQERIVYVQATQIDPPLITRPELDTELLKPGMDAGEVLQLHRLTIIKLMAWGTQLEGALNVYRTKGKPNE